MDNIAIYGSGSFGHEVFLLIDLINKTLNKPAYNFIGFFDDSKKIGTKCKYGSIIGGINEINQLQDRVNLAIAVGSSTGLFDMRTKIYNPNIIFPNLMSPYNLYFDRESVNFGIGNIILCNSIISYDVIIGNFNIINTRVNFGHHVEIGDFNILNPNTQLSGNSKIGNNNSLGLNSALLPKKSIGNFNVVVPGSIITRNFKNNNFIAGNPAMNIKL